MVVLIDSGSTTFALGAMLAQFSDLTVITNSLSIALLPCRSPGVKVIVPGRDVDPNDEAALPNPGFALMRSF
jgi:DeoR/GlpR family transcriptional regulator of sugar metabolism